LPFHERHGHLRRVGQELARFDDDGNARVPSSLGSIATSGQSSERTVERAAPPTAMSVKN